MNIIQSLNQDKNFDDLAAVLHEKIEESRSPPKDLASSETPMKLDFEQSQDKHPRKERSAKKTYKQKLTAEQLSSKTVARHLKFLRGELKRGDAAIQELVL